MLIDTIEHILRVGCGISLQKVVQSKRFAKLQADQKQLFERHSARSHRGTALRAGHLVMGRLFNTCSEKDALKRARRESSEFGHGIQSRALIQMTGEHLVEAARNCLPRSVVELAKEWKTSTADEQIDIVYRLYHLLRSDRQESKGELTIDSVWKSFHSRQNEIDDDRCIFPRLYGPFEKDKSPANCQGKSQMLVAFARLAGARVLAISPVHHGRDLQGKFRRDLRDRIARDLRERGLEDGDVGFSKSLNASYTDDRLRERDTFHVGTAIKLRDNRWAIIDPHGLSWGVLDPAWDMNSLFKQLTKYSEVLPGLQLIGHDHGKCQTTLKAQFERGVGLLEKSRILEQRIKASAINLADLIGIIADSGFLGELLEIHIESEGDDPIPDIRAPMMQSMLASQMVLGDIWNIDKLFVHMDDQEYITKKTKSMLSFFHCCAISLLREQLTEAGDLVHPVCEFGMPEYHLAISAINSVDIHHRTRMIGDQFYIDHSFDQVSLHNAMGQNTSHALATAAHEALQSLPFIHNMCRRKMYW